MKFLIKLIASGLGTGYSPLAPGTAGSALAAIVVWLLAPWWGPGTAAAATVGAFIIGVFCTGRAEKFWGHDDGRMVIDEVAGMFLSLSLVPAGLRNIVIAFLIFRVFDILKPPPARAAERLPGGWGVMTDDIVAGAYTAVVMWGIAGWM